MQKALDLIVVIGLAFVFFYYGWQAEAAERAGDFEEEVRCYFKAIIALVACIGIDIVNRVRQ